MYSEKRELFQEKIYQVLRNWSPVVLATEEICMCGDFVTHGEDLIAGNIITDVGGGRVSLEGFENVGVFRLGRLAHWEKMYKLQRNKKKHPKRAY